LRGIAVINKSRLKNRFQIWEIYEEANHHHLDPLAAAVKAR
jgi:hypothetical protein